MKELVIGLLILVSGEKIETRHITIYESCYTWYQKNVEMKEIKTTFLAEDLIICMKANESLVLFVVIKNLNEY